MSAIESLSQTELFGNLPEDDRRAIAELGRGRRAGAGAVLFRQGDVADELYVLCRGRVELTFPLVVLGETKEARFQSLEPGRTLSWSALVPDYRLTLGARATTDAELVSFAREALLRLFEQRPAAGLAVMSNLTRVVAARLREMQALWVRELQRNVSSTYR